MEHVVYLDCAVESLVFVWVHSRMHPGACVAFVVGGSNAERQLALLQMWLVEIRHSYKEVCVIRGHSGDRPFNVDSIASAPRLPPDVRAIEQVMARPMAVYFLRRPDPIEVPKGDFSAATCFGHAAIEAREHVETKSEFVAPAPAASTHATGMLRTIMECDGVSEISLRFVSLLMPETTNAFVTAAVFQQTIGGREGTRSGD